MLARGQKNINDQDTLFTIQSQPLFFKFLVDIHLILFSIKLDKLG